MQSSFACDTKVSILEALEAIEDSVFIQTIRKTFVNYEHFPTIQIAFSDFFSNFEEFATHSGVKILLCSPEQFEILSEHHTVEELFLRGFLIIY